MLKPLEDLYYETSVGSDGFASTVAQKIIIVELLNMTESVSTFTCNQYNTRYLFLLRLKAKMGLSRIHARKRNRIL